MPDPASLFVPEGDVFVPTEWTRGPWDPNAQHGGPPAALVARAVEQCEPDPEWFVARMTVELLRPVPLAPLSVRATLVRAGRRVQRVEAVLSTGGKDVCVAVGLRIRRSAPAVPEALLEHSVPVPPPQQGLRQRGFSPISGFHTDGAELRFVQGAFEGAGPAFVWIRLAAPVVPGEVPSPLQRVAAAADFGNGVSAVLDYERFRFLNPDLTVYLEREPRGEWVGLDAVTHVGPDGVALAESRLYDLDGPIGRSLQSLLVEER